MQRVVFILVLYVYTLNQILCEIEDTPVDNFERDMSVLLSDVTSEENVSPLDEAVDSASSEVSNELPLKTEDIDEETLNSESAEQNIMSEESLKQFMSELLAGSTADLFGTNQHYKQPTIYKDLGRRFVLQYPYSDISRKSKKSEVVDRLVPQAAPPELVLAVAKKSALLQASEPQNPTDDVIRREILRTGEYWNGVWKEDVDPNNLLRSVDKTKNNLETVKLQVMPGSKFYEIVNKLKEISPRLVYVINKNKS